MKIFGSFDKAVISQCQWYSYCLNFHHQKWDHNVADSIFNLNIHVYIQYLSPPLGALASLFASTIWHIWLGSHFVSRFFPLNEIWCFKTCFEKTGLDRDVPNSQTIDLSLFQE